MIKNKKLNSRIKKGDIVRFIREVEASEFRCIASRGILAIVQYASNDEQQKISVKFDRDMFTFGYFSPDDVIVVEPYVDPTIGDKVKIIPCNETNYKALTGIIVQRTSFNHRYLLIGVKGYPYYKAVYFDREKILNTYQERCARPLEQRKEEG